MLLSQLSAYYLTLPKETKLNSIKDWNGATFIFKRSLEIETFLATNSSISNLSERCLIIDNCEDNIFVVNNKEVYFQFIIPYLTSLNFNNIYIYNDNDIQKTPEDIKLTRLSDVKETIEYKYSHEMLEHTYFKFVKEAYDYAKAQSATLIACKYPNTGNINNPSEREKNLKTYTIDVYKLNDEKFGFKDVYNHTDGFNDEYIRSIYSIDDQILDENGILVPSDQTGTHVNVINRMRYTVANPEIFDTTVHVFGPSYIFCTGSEDSGTLTSHMQHFFNIDKTYDKNAKSVRVLNYSICGDHRFFSIDRLKQANIRKGDIVIFFFYVMVASGQTTRLNKSIEQRLILNEIPFFDLNYSLNRPHNYGEVFIDEDHLAPKGNKVVAKELYSLIKQKEEINEKLIPKINNLYAEVSKRIIPEHNSQLEAYIESIKHFAKNKNDIGAIVVNANPFTNGHKYLVSKAAETVDYLYVFVVKEDKSFFKFSDRFSLVQQGVSDIKNVAVISGGKFIISSVTFPEYFNKDNLREMTIDASDDLTIFCEKICPALNIKKRFVGEEPFCPVTRQYNEQMKKILPQFGIELVEIERVASNDHKISASYVRKLLAEKNFEIIKEIVPETTYNFLYRNYNE